MDLLSGLFGAPLPSVTVRELNDKLNAASKPLVVDVREPEEYQDAHISHAKLIPLGDLRQRINELPKDAEIVCVCASGSRSSMATKMLVGAGFSAINMKGGMYTWEGAGLPVSRGNAI
ncbi:MAG: rhodanese-like domain-containing protein [Chloroflexota bacterium]